MRNALSQERFQTTFVLDNERKNSVIESVEGFAKFVTSVFLFKEFFCDCSVAYVKIFNRRTGFEHELGRMKKLVTRSHLSKIFLAL